MARCYFGRVLACVWLTSLKGDERDHNVFERVRIHDFTGTLCHPSGLPKVCTETGNFLTVTRDLTSFLGVTLPKHMFQVIIITWNMCFGSVTGSFEVFMQFSGTRICNILYL